MNIRVVIDSYPFLKTLRTNLGLSKEQQYESIRQLCELLDNDLNKFYNNINHGLKLNQIFATDVSNDLLNLFKNVLAGVAMELFFKLRELKILETNVTLMQESLFVEHIDDNSLVLNIERNVI